MKNITKKIRVRRSLSVVGLAFGLLIQCEIAQASWISEWLGINRYYQVLPAVRRIENKGSLPRACTLQEGIALAKLAQNIIDLENEKKNNIDWNDKSEHQLYKAILAYNDNNEEIVNKNFNNEYHESYRTARSLEKDRDFIQPYGCFGLRCLALPISSEEKNYKQNLIHSAENPLDIININDHATLQFNKEYGIYQKRIMTATGIVLAATVAGMAGYAWANKK